MEGFKNYVQTQSENKEIIQELQGLKRAAQMALKFIMDAIKPLTFHEAGYDIAREIESYVIRSPVFTEYMQSNFNATARKSGIWYAHSCGQDGCAFFFTNNIVVKFSSDYREMKIAEQVAGILKRIPIMAAIELEVEATEAATYAIVMRQLDTDSANSLRKGYSHAYSVFAGTLDHLMDLVKKKPDLPVEYIKRRLSMAYMLRQDTMSKESIPYLEDLVRAIRTVYIHSGYLLGADWTNRNLGFTKKGRVQPFDFGRAYEHPAAQEKVKPVTRNRLVIPKMN